MIDPQYMQRQVREDEYYPSGEEMQKHVSARRRTGSIFRWGFLVATIIAIIFLLILLLTIINQSFGLVAEQVEIPESDLVTNFNKTRVISAANIIESNEDDQSLAESVAGDPLGTGFFGYAFYKANENNLRALSIDGSPPSLESVNSGQYPGVRPLYLYSSPSIIEEKEAVGAFLLYYLTNLNEVINEVGYFPADSETLAEQEQEILAALGMDSMPVINPAEYEGDITIAGSSTVFPITQMMAERFIADGFSGEISVESTGTGGGFNAFCFENEAIDIVDASRPATVTESDACRANDHPLSEIRIGTDAVVAAVSKENEFAEDVTLDQLNQIFSTAVNWSDIDPGWPDEEVHRYIPTADSGTMDFFVQSIFAEQSLEQLPYDALVGIYVANVSKGRCRAIEREQRFYADSYVCDDPAKFEAACSSENPPTGCTAEPRDVQNVELLIQSEVVKPVILQSWYLYPSIFQREEIILEASDKYPNAALRFKSWLSTDFITSPQSSTPELAGVRTAIIGSLWVVLISTMVAFPLGVAAAVYLEEYADDTKWYNRVIQTNINNLAGVPSIIYGMLGLAVFVRALEPFTSGALFGVIDAGATANGRTILSAGLTLGLLGLPIVIIAAQEAVKAVPQSLREASMGLGATKWQTIWNHVLPNALPGILTGTILTMSRVIGETAPLVVVGASTFITSDPTGPFSKFTTLPAQIFQWTTRPQDTFRNIAGAAIVVLLVLLLLLNATAIYMRNRFTKQLT